MWIKCSERLPEENTMVLIALSYYGNKEISMGFVDEGRWVDGMPGQGLNIIQQDYVTHWMPLPSPPEDDE